MLWSKPLEWDPIVVEAIMKGKSTRICTTNKFNMLKLHANLLLLRKLMLNSLKVRFNLIKCTFKFYNGEAIAIA